MRFVLISLTWDTRVVEGDSIVDACLAENIYPGPIHSYVNESSIIGISGCPGCSKSVGDTLFCRCDFESYLRNGVPTNSFDVPFPNLSDDEIRQVIRHFAGPCPDADEDLFDFGGPTLFDVTPSFG